MKNLSIYYTDDDPEDQELFQEVILEETQNFRIQLQKDGYELMEQLASTSVVPYIIFLDLNIPKKNGVQVLKELKSSEKLRSIPVVILTTSSDPRTINNLRELGASFFITKPELYDDLKKAILFALSIQWDLFEPSEENFIFKS